MLNLELQESRASVIRLNAELVQRELGQMYDKGFVNGTGMLFTSTKAFRDFQENHSETEVETLVIELGPPDAVSVWREYLEQSGTVTDYDAPGIDLHGYEEINNH